mmetsp:Transcript_21329/g.67470  ORF Transcript_21329/g.67470 Transcript_21329/m.67470 type:complete len:292 (-) Transcript_21329:241-1116(-)
MLRSLSKEEAPSVLHAPNASLHTPRARSSEVCHVRTLLRWSSMWFAIVSMFSGVSSLGQAILMGPTASDISLLPQWCCSVLRKASDEGEPPTEYPARFNVYLHTEHQRSGENPWGDAPDATWESRATRAIATAAYAIFRFSMRAQPGDLACFPTLARKTAPQTGGRRQHGAHPGLHGPGPRPQDAARARHAHVHAPHLRASAPPDADRHDQVWGAQGEEARDLPGGGVCGAVPCGVRDEQRAVDGRGKLINRFMFKRAECVVCVCVGSGDSGGQLVRSCGNCVGASAECGH